MYVAIIYLTLYDKLNKNCFCTIMERFKNFFYLLTSIIGLFVWNWVKIEFLHFIQKETGKLQETLTQITQNKQYFTIKI